MNWYFFNRELSWEEEEYWLAVFKKFGGTPWFADRYGVPLPTRLLLGFEMSEFDYMWMTMYQGEGYAGNGRYEGMSI
jgi:hypothetical protein